jgi:hypothetical protein
MSKSNHFRQYAEEAMRSAHQSKIQEEKEAFIELARTWTAAVYRANGSLSSAAVRLSSGLRSERPKE